MGLRGPLPQLRTAAAEKLHDLTPPPWLSAEAAAYWTRHAATLARNSLLTLQTADSFALCCDLWGRVRELSDQPTTRSYLDTVKAYNQLAKLFRLVPCDKPGAPVDRRHDDKGEFQFG